jgi:hypothetical protein
VTPERIGLRAATSDDDAFVVEMARHACVIEDWPLPDSDDEVQEMLPRAGVVPIIAEDRSGTPIGAVWTYHGSPPLRCDAAGCRWPNCASPLHQSIAGPASAACCSTRSLPMLRRITTRCAPTSTSANPAKRLYERKGFRAVDQGNGPLGLALVKDLRSIAITDSRP